MTGLFNELSRRRVYRVAVSYAIAAWAVVQVADVVFPALSLPAWTVTWIVVVAIAGFPVSLVLAWLFDITPSGLVRTLQPLETGDGIAELPPATPRRVHLVAAVAFVFGTAGLLAWLLRPKDVAAFPSQGWALLATFENQTGEEGLDVALMVALAVALEQSPYVNIAAGQRVDDALRRMRLDPNTPLEPDVARQVAIREGLDVLLLPSVATVGGRYVLAVRVEEPGDGQVLRTVSVRANRRDELLDALDELAVELRSYLGESGSAIARYRKPLEQATTSSLEALQEYSLGFEAQRRGLYRDAKLHYENAVRTDTTFARALASLGTLEWEKGNEFRGGMREYEGFDPERGKELLRRALAHSENTTEREGLGIRAVHALAVEGNVQEAAEHYRIRATEYPDDYVSHNNLGRLYYYLGRYQESVESYKRAIGIAGGLTGAYDGVVASYLYLLGRVDSALVWAQREVAADSSYFRAFDNLGWAYIGVDSVAAAAVAFERAVALNPEYTLARARLGHAHRLLGEYERAVDAFEEIARLDPDDTSIFYDLGVTFSLAGDRGRMTENLTRSREAIAREAVDGAPAPAFFQLATVAMRLGDSVAAADAEARGLAALANADAFGLAYAQGRRRATLDERGYFELAALRSVQGRSEQALIAIDSAFAGGFTNYIWLLLHPDFQGLRDDGRFRDRLDQALHRPLPTPP
jgi:tetratricopeptide (TPR) repeat protein